MGRGEGKGGRGIAYIIDMDYPMLVLLNGTQDLTQWDGGEGRGGRGIAIIIYQY